MARRKDIPAIVAVCLTAILLIATALLPPIVSKVKERANTSFLNVGETLNALIDQSSQQKGSDKLIIGYSYFLINSFADDAGVASSIKMAGSDSAALQALLRSDVDIVSVPADKHFDCNDVIYSNPLEGFCKWAMLRSRSKDLILINDWISRYHDSDSRAFIKRRFFSPSSPWNRHLTCASPYDSLIRKSASLHGWDWRLIAAVIHQESKFHIESVSHHGAKGLCQFVDGTARVYGISNILDPEENIEACAKYLKRLYILMSGYDRDDRLKLTLASYNGGLGTVLDCISYADSCNLGSGWDAVREAMLIQSRDSILVEGTDSLIANPDGGKYLETADYVGKVLSCYEAYKKRLPE